MNNLAFALEYSLGHTTHEQNLKRVLEGDRSLRSPMRTCHTTAPEHSSKEANIMSIQNKPRPIRFVNAISSATLGSLRHPTDVMAFARDAFQHPLRYQASKLIEKVPAASFTELFPAAGDQRFEVSISDDDFSRQGWNVRLDEQILIGLAIKRLKAQNIFEIGTFNGRTTKQMAEAAGPDAQVFTLDLPPTAVDAFNMEDFKGVNIGEVHRKSPFADRVTQLAGDSQSFDFSPYLGKMDFVFVDAAHDYKAGIADSATALRLIRHGGVIFWHDFVPQWCGLVHGIVEATAGRGLIRLGGTSIAVVVEGR